MTAELLSALCLMLVIEGAFVFLSPVVWKRTLEQLMQMEDRTLRRFGLVMMLLGVGLLHWLRGG